MSKTQFFDPIYPTLGFCTSGPASGAYLGFFPLASGEGGRSWDAALSIPLPSEGLFRGDVFELDPRRESDLALIERWGVVAVPEPAASHGLYALFAGLLENTPPRGGPGISGRLASGLALQVLMETLVGNAADLSKSDIQVDQESITTSLGQIENVIDQVAALLAANGYSISVVPIRAKVDSSTVPPWVEYLE